MTRADPPLLLLLVWQAGIIIPDVLRERYFPPLLASIPDDTAKPYVVGFDAEVTRTNLDRVLGELKGEPKEGPTPWHTPRTSSSSHHAAWDGHPKAQALPITPHQGLAGSQEGI